MTICSDNGPARLKQSPNSHHLSICRKLMLTVFIMHSSSLQHAHTRSHTHRHRHTPSFMSVDSEGEKCDARAHTHTRTHTHTHTHTHTRPHTHRFAHMTNIRDGFSTVGLLRSHSFSCPLVLEERSSVFMVHTRPVTAPLSAFPRKRYYTVVSQYKVACVYSNSDTGLYEAMSYAFSSLGPILGSLRACDSLTLSFMRFGTASTN